MTKPLAGKVAVVAGATRGAGRGIAKSDATCSPMRFERHGVRSSAPFLPPSLKFDGSRREGAKGVIVRPSRAAVALIVCLCVRASTAAADEVTPDEPPSAPALVRADPRWWERIDLHAYADVYYAYNFNRPTTGTSFIPGTGTTAKRANEFSLNLAAIDLGLKPEPVGFRLIVNYGSAADILHAGEPTGTGIGPEVWRFVQQASISGRIPIGRGLLVEGGIMPCHAGFEVFASKDNWNYTRSWMADLSPYYQAGVRASYAFTDRWSAQLHVLNGWQIIGENNEAKTLGTQIAWATERVTISWNTLAGPELPNDNAHWRLFSDVVVAVRPLEWLHLGAIWDIAHQQRPAASGAYWTGAAGYVRVIPRKWLAWALRGEYFHDPDAGISGASQDLTEGTATIELRPHDNLILKLESRYDHSTGAVFTSRRLAADGTPLLVHDQGLVVLGAVVTM